MEESTSPTFNTRRRKRRSLSPDLFGDVETDQPDLIISKHEGKPTFSGSPVDRRTKNCGKMKVTPKRKILSPISMAANPNFLPTPVSWLKSPMQSSMCSSLQSTANNCGLNSRLKSVIRSNTDSQSRLDISSLPSSNETQAVYTLNNKNPEVTQKSVFSGPFFGLSEAVWKIVQECKGIASLYEWQKECLTKALDSNHNLLYSLPTSGGKTLVSEMLMVRELLCNRKNSLYILPYVSIVQEKIRTLSSLAVSLNFAVEEFAGTRGSFPPRKRESKRVIYIATLEKAHGIVNSLMELGRLAEIGLVVVDEVHMIGENGKRGATLESLLCKLLLSPISPRIVAMSATIGNLNELSDFLKADVYTGKFRPVQLKEYIKMGDILLQVNEDQRKHENHLEHCRSFTSQTAASRRIDPDGVGVLVGEVVPQHCCLVFCPTKKNCESVAQLVSRTLPRSLLEWKVAEKRRLKQALKQESGQMCPVLRVTLPYGIAYHHSGLTADERQLIEEAFLAGTLCCLCCTSTLAAGVNLPARRVILRSPYMGAARLTRGRYQQMIGRAGRAGFDTHGESIMIIKGPELSFITQEILLAPTDRVESQLAGDNLRGLQQLILSLVALDLGGKDCSQLAETVLHSTLIGQQSSQLTVSSKDLVEQSVKFLIEKKLLASGKEDRVLQVTKLGRATLKGCVDLDVASVLYQDLRQAQAGLVLLSKLHLMFLVTPYDLIGSVNPVATTYFQVFNKLSEEELGVARSLGINEAVMVKLMSNQQPKIERNILQRFYLTLMLNDVWKGQSFWAVSELYGCARGDVQNLVSSAASFASCVCNFTQELEEFWAFSELLSPFSRELSLCCTAELIPLMELPSVGKGRARLLYEAGYRTLTDVAKSNAADIVAKVDHLPRRVAQQMIAAAKVLVFEKAEVLMEEANSLLSFVPRPRPPPSASAYSMDETFQSQTQTSQASNLSIID